EDLRAFYQDRVPGGADLVMYWFERARAQIACGKARRAGLLGPQTIRRGVSSPVLQRIKETGDIFYAQANRPWSLASADVNVCMIGFDDGLETVRLLNESKDDPVEKALERAREVPWINADL